MCPGAPVAKSDDNIDTVAECVFVTSLGIYIFFFFNSVIQGENFEFVELCTILMLC